MIASIAVAITAYSNHFDNSFHFDDSHTIENNLAIRDFTPSDYFTDATTFSSNPNNQSYRPLTTLENAIDYKVANGLTPRVFHIHIFTVFIFVCIAIFVFTQQLLDISRYSSKNKYWALFAATGFGVLCANAETVNYIIQRAEITTALFILLGLITYVKGGFWRKYHLYLLFAIIGFVSKEMGFVFAPLLFIYIALFEKNVDISRIFSKNEFRKILSAFKHTIPAIFVTILYLLFYSKMLTQTYTTGSVNWYNYFITQPMVIMHYLVSYFIPYNLSADTDWKVYESIFDHRAMTGFVLLIIYVLLAIFASRRKETKIISFGMLWFLIALLPTSSFLPFAEVMNDHRPFIPYIGITIAFAAGIRLAYNKVGRKSLKIALIIILMMFIGLNAYGVRERNKVWKSEFSLWQDVADKSPNNGRGLMNYGLALMKIGDYSNAEKYFNKALPLLPNYSHLYINLGILNNAQGNAELAENYFKIALTTPTASHSTWYFYGKYLKEHNRLGESVFALEKSVAMSPNYPHSNELLARVYLSLSMEKYNSGDYLKCIDIAQKSNAITANPSAYSNIGAAYNALGEFEKAIEACNKALALDSTHLYAKGNLEFAIKSVSIGK